jgi:hypothetical protein
MLRAILYQEAAMLADSKVSPHLIALFDQQPCWMIEPLASELGYSVPSTRRFLGEAGYFSSFTHNGKWYTLRFIPHFDRDGLWFHDAIGFSHAGSLTKTLIRLTVRSPAGMTAEQLGGKLRCRCHSVLVQLWRKGELQRRKSGRSHVYLAVDSAIQTIQIQALAGQRLSSLQLPAEVAVFILAEFINHPDFSLAQLAKAVTRRCRIPLKTGQIEALFEQHGLKKTTPTTAPRH